MPKFETYEFNKEKLIFLATAITAAAGLYMFLASAPVALATGKPISNLDRPAQHDLVQLEGLWNIGRYLLGDRESPFTQGERRKSNETKISNGTKYPQPVPDLHKDESNLFKAKLVDPGKDMDVQVSFVGTIMARPNEPALALLRSKVDGNMLCKKKGDVFTVGGIKYTVANIEKQAIWVIYGDGNPYTLNDGGFAGGDAHPGGQKRAKNQPEGGNF